MKSRPLKDRVEENIVRIPFSECWFWRLAPGSHGYGQMMFPDHKPRLAHRLVYELYVGPIPDGMHVLHKCDVRGCCNPLHLFLGTAKDNMQDCKRKGRNSPPPVGVNFKLTADQRKEIYSRFSSGERADKLSSEFNIDKSRVHQINRHFNEHR